MRPLLPRPIASLVLFASLTSSGIRPEAAAHGVREQPLRAPHGVTIRVGMEGPLPAVVMLLVEERWQFRLHASHDESNGLSRTAGGASLTGEAM
jgi:hypothetical protein